MKYSLPLLALLLSGAVAVAQEPPSQPPAAPEPQQQATEDQDAEAQLASQEPGAAAPQQPATPQGRGTGQRSTPQSATQQQPDPAFMERYGLLLQNNIFLQDRRPPRQAPVQQTTRPTPAPPPAEKGWMLTGIVFEHGTFRAYFENLASGEATRLLPGEAIANGQLAEIYIDAIAYRKGDDVVWVQIGHDLTGAVPAAIANAPAQRPQTPSRTAARPQQGRPIPPGSPQALSIEERLRQRRLQEAGGNPEAAPPAAGQDPGGIEDDPLIEPDDDRDD